MARWYQFPMPVTIPWTCRHGGLWYSGRHLMWYGSSNDLITGYTALKLLWYLTTTFPPILHSWHRRICNLHAGLLPSNNITCIVEAAPTRMRTCYRGYISTNVKLRRHCRWKLWTLGLLAPTSSAEFRSLYLWQHGAITCMVCSYCHFV